MIIFKWGFSKISRQRATGLKIMVVENANTKYTQKKKVYSDWRAVKNQIFKTVKTISPN